MSINNFLSKNNIQLIWDVLIDEDVFKNRSKETIANINILFNKIIKDFFESEKHKYNDLIDMNKQFIRIIIDYINKYYPLKLNTTSISNIPYQNNNNNSNFPYQNKGPITSEDIQQNRMSQFEKELNVKQQEFTNAITLPVPPTPNFSDKLDEPIGEMEQAIKQMMAQRKYDIDLMSQNFNNNNDSSNWLKSQETSIKNDRVNRQQNNTQNTNNNNIVDNHIDSFMRNNKLKYIKIDNKDIIDITFEKEVIDLNKKQLSWSDNNTTFEYDELDNINVNIDSKSEKEINNNKNNTDSNNILNKLKLLPDNSKVSKNTNYYTRLENKIDNLNDKMDIIIKLLEQKIK